MQFGALLRYTDIPITAVPFPRLLVCCGGLNLPTGGSVVRRLCVAYAHRRRTPVLPAPTMPTRTTSGADSWRWTDDVKGGGVPPTNCPASLPPQLPLPPLPRAAAPAVAGTPSTLFYQHSPAYACLVPVVGRLVPHTTPHTCSAYPQHNAVSTTFTRPYRTAYRATHIYLLSLTDGRAQNAVVVERTTLVRWQAYAGLNCPTPTYPTRL